MPGGTSHHGRRAVAALAAALVTASLSACGGGQADADSGGTTEVTVLAASSLTDVFKKIGAAYERREPDTEVRFSFAGSQVLAAQVAQGAPGDVLATADTRTMDGVRADTGKPVVFAENRLVVVTREGNPEDIENLRDLDAPGLKVVLAAEEVPVGNYSARVLERQGVELRPVSRETDVRAVLSKVELGEADAGLVYRTDAATAPDKVDAVRIPDAANESATYPAAALKVSEHPDLAADFVHFLSSPEAQRILREAGFQQP
jgi:molybdate transport system substrate-binding protein